MKLHSRIFTLLLLTLVGLGATSMVFLYHSAKNAVEKETAERLKIAQRTFYDVLDSQHMFLNTSVETVVKDWGLRQAAGQKDGKTLESVLGNHSNRINADVALFIDREGGLSATTLANKQKLPERITALVQSAGAETFQRIAALHGRYYQLVFSEVKAPVTVGWVGMGFAIDNALAQRYSQLTGVNISFVRPGDGGTQFVASTLPEERRLAMERYRLVNADGVWPVKIDDWEDLALYEAFDSSGASNLGVLLQRSLDQPRAQFSSWWWSLFSIFLLFSLLALIVAYFFARGITRPLSQLLSAVKDVSRGDYSTPIRIQRRDEIGFLSKAFSQMQFAIAEREDEIQYRADHDLTTELLNRNGFLGKLAEKIDALGEAGKQLVIVCCRLNHFQEINDALGHSWGDKLLQLVAQRLVNDLRDQHLAHVNADEFAMIFTVDNVSAAYTLGDAIHGCFDKGFEIRGISLALSVAVGVSVYPESASDAQSLLRRASVALNEAAESRLPTVVYDPELDQNSVKRLTLMSELPKAIREGQMCLHFQPKLRRYADRQVVESVECLVRWTHPELGFVPPDDFIGLAEKTGYITELTRWVMEQALAQSVKWRRQNLDLAVAVNISALDLQQENFEQTVNDLLRRHKLPAGSLTLEVTESAAMQDPDAAVAQLSKLANLGIKLSVDDYGTGYSSLAQLKKLPVHELKIDKSFVMELDRNEDDKIIVRSTIELGHNIGLAIVAEGVEDNRSLLQLVNWECDYLQGFHIGKPMAIGDLDEWLANTGYPVRKLISGVDSTTKAG